MPSKTYISPRRFYEILNRIADRNIGPVERAFLTAARIAAFDINPGALTAALLARDVFRAFDAVGLNGQLEARTKAHMARALRTVFAQSAQVAAVPMNAALGSTLAGRFNITNRRAVAYAEKAAGALVKQVSASTKANIRRIVVRGFTEQRTIRQSEKDIAALLVKRVRSTMGLTVKQFEAVETRRAAWNLRATIQSTVKERGRDAIDSIAIDLGVAPQKIHAALNKPPISAEQAEGRAERYAKRQLKLRANNIARTETITASAKGQQAIWREAQAQGLIEFDADLPTQYETPNGPVDGPTAHPRCRCAERIEVVDGIARRFWVITPDDRLCPVCAAIPGRNEEGIGLADVETLRLSVTA